LDKKRGAINKKEFHVKSGDYFRIPKNTFHSLKVKSKNSMKVLSVQSPEFLGKDRIFEKPTNNGSEPFDIKDSIQSY
jgi:mannose-6-phosphate isomerase-like protein (cupin superfamily)